MSLTAARTSEEGRGLACPASINELSSVAGGWTTREVQIAGRTLLLTHPADPDALLDDPAVEAAHAVDGYMPYWGYIWPAAWDMSAAVLQEDWTSLGEQDVLEIGCGVGVVGLAALVAGLRVTFSDYDAQSVALALYNSRQNALGTATGLVLDWRRPLARRYPLIIACDLIYERGNHEPILGLLDAMLTDDGVCWLADPGRAYADPFFKLADQRGYRFDCRKLPVEDVSGRGGGQTNLWLVRRG